MGKIREGKYLHYKGNIYNVIGIARSSEDPKREFVVYQGQYTDREFGKNPIWVRPKRMFVGKVTVNGKRVQRFKPIRDQTEKS